MLPQKTPLLWAVLASCVLHAGLLYLHAPVSHAHAPALPLHITLQRLMPTLAPATRPSPPQAALPRPAPPKAPPTHLPSPATRSHALGTPPKPLAQPAIRPMTAPLPASAQLSAPASAPQASGEAHTDTIPVPPPTDTASRPAPIPPAASGPSLSDYGLTLSQRLAGHQSYPRIALVRGWEGQVMLRLVIARKGQLLSVTVLQSSGHSALDDSAMALVNAAAPFPPPPVTDRDAVEINVPVSYHLNNKG